MTKGVTRCLNPSPRFSFTCSSAPRTASLSSLQKFETEMHPYMATILRELKSPSLAIDGTCDHVHILFSLTCTIALADLVEELKTSTSKWVKTKGREFRNFHWQRGYAAFSIGQSNVARMKRYIHRQKEHHLRITIHDG